MSKSEYEQKIGNHLTEINIRYETEFHAVIQGHNRRFDFYLPDYRTLMEYDGEQHFKDNYFFKTSFAKSKRIDLIKNRWAKDNNYHLLRIPYKKRDEYIRIINNFLRSVRRNPRNIKGPSTRYFSDNCIGD